MSAAALFLVLAAAVLHATWNFFVKRIGGGVAFTWLLALFSSLLFTIPAAIILVRTRPTFSGTDWLFIGGSAVLHLAYFLTLQAGYRRGDLSLVYPLARGTAPLLTTIGAIVFLAERPGALALTGIALIIGSVFFLTGGINALRKPQAAGSGDAVRFGLLTGMWIAGYSLWDKYAVGVLLLNPLLFSWLSSVARAVILLPAAAARRAELRDLWRQHRLTTLLVAFLSSLAYILVLTAMSFTDVSYVAPAREVSILFGAFLGAQLLGEGNVRQRLLAAGGMAAGVACLALG